MHNMGKFFKKNALRWLCPGLYYTQVYNIFPVSERRVVLYLSQNTVAIKRTGTRL